MIELNVKEKSKNSVIDKMSIMGHEQVVHCFDKETGLKAIIAIHDTTLGPALGGTRMWNYENSNHALLDVLRLSRGMSLKASISGLDLGGGKAVIIGDSKKNKTPELMRKFGQYVDSLGGRYITAEDVPGDDNNEIKFFTDGEERMRITAAGDISLNRSSLIFTTGLKNGDFARVPVNPVQVDLSQNAWDISYNGFNLIFF